jgi:predicted GTPase
MAFYRLLVSYGAAGLSDLRPYLRGRLTETFREYPEFGHLLPAMGYGAKQIADLEETIAAVPCDSVILGTPIDLTRVLKIEQPYVRVRYELEEVGQPDLAQVLADFFDPSRPSAAPHLDKRISGRSDRSHPQRRTKR